jgi:prephenate dehydrogenase
VLDSDSKDQKKIDQITIGIVGFGAFGRLIAQHLHPYFQLYAFDPAAPAAGRDESLGVTFADIATVAKCRIVVLAMPVNQLEQAIAAIGPHLQAGTLVLDVGSVKVIPADIMRRDLPAHVDIIGTHPLFGPQSARNGIKGLKIALCPIRGKQVNRVAAFLRKTLGLTVFITTPEAHDQELATVQGLTHLIAKVLVQMEPLPTRMTTTSFDMIMKAVEMVRYDAPEVFLAIERSNPYSASVREQFFKLSAELNSSLSRSKT